MNHDTDLMPLSECAKLLHCATGDLVRMRRLGRFPPIYRLTARRLLIDRGVFFEWLDTRRVDVDLGDQLLGRFK